MSNNTDIYSRQPAPLAPYPTVENIPPRRDDISQPIPYGMDTGVFSAPWQQSEIQDRRANVDIETKFQENVPGVKRSTDRWEGQLPYSTTPKAYGTPGLQMIPQSTRIDAVCFREALDNSGPFYLRHWQIWDNAPFLPSGGDVSLDPKYHSMQTKGFTSSYLKLPR